MSRNKEIQRQILLTLYDSDTTFTNLNDLIKSLKLSRKEIIEIFSILEFDGIICSDNKWREFCQSNAGIDMTVDEVSFNFRITPEGEKLVREKYINIRKMKQSETTSSHSEAISEGN